MTPHELMPKAQRALASAQLLLDSGDVDGVCNRAYYAMFDAARAALLWVQAPVPAEIARTHSGLISAFSLHLVKPGLIAVQAGRASPRPFRRATQHKHPQGSRLRPVTRCPNPIRT